MSEKPSTAQSFEEPASTSEIFALFQKNFGPTLQNMAADRDFAMFAAGFRAALAARTVAPSLDVEKIADEIVIALRKWDASRGYSSDRSSRRQVIAGELKRHLESTHAI